MDWLLSKYSEIHKNIEIWYKEHGRLTLPWRNTNDPYRIYLSEIMLQQTQVKTVLQRFYFPFLERFPTLKSVAEAPVDDVLKAWEGLGYYTRARNLHKTAIKTEGILPSSAEELEQLSGVGKSTAHAIASFAFNQPLPILDANVKRILYRFFAITKCNDKHLWKRAYELFDKENSYLYNQAMMDIGTSICTHKSPNCLQCPFESLCQGKKNPLLYPEKKTTKTKPIRTRFILIYSQDNRYLLKKNRTELLSGLWSFPQEEQFKRKVTDRVLGSFKHHYTHFRLDATVLLLETKNSTDLPLFTLDEIERLALSGADRKALSLLKLFNFRNKNL